MAFAAVETRKVRVRVTGALDGYSRVTELEAWGPEGAAGGATVNWLVADHLGTPRMVVDQTGALSGVSRHDYLPFGEQVGAGVGGRTMGQGYWQPDGVRQGFTGYEKDGETELNFAQNRYYSPTQGRFTSVDPENAGASEEDPQSWNGYAYAGNSPLKYIDPLGLWKQVECSGGASQCWQWEEGDDWSTLGVEAGFGNGAGTALGTYFSGQELGPDLVVDVSGFMGWYNGLDPLRERMMLREWDVDFGGGLKTGGPQAARGGGLLSRFWNWVRGGGSKKVTETIPTLSGATGKEMTREAIRIIQSSGGSASQKADLFERLSIQIMEQTGGSWNAVRALGTDGSHIFMGRGGELLVISPQGQLFRGTVRSAIRPGTGNALTPMYEALKPVN